MKKISAKTVFFCIGLFVVFVILRFPYGNLKGMIFEKIYGATKIQILAEDIYPSLFGWPGIGIKNVDVTLPVADDEISLNSKKLIFKVGLGHLFPPVPSVSLNMISLKKGGDLFLKIAQSKATIDLSFDADNVELEQIKYTALSEPITGNLTAEGKFSLDTGNLEKSNGQGELNLKKFTLPTFTIQMSPSYGFPIPAMKIGKIEGKPIIKNGTFSLQNFVIGDAKSDLQGTLAGEIRLGKDWLASSVDLTLKFQLSDEYIKNPNATTLLSTLNTFRSEKSGRYGMRCKAKIDDIVNRFACAIPEKVEN